MTARAVPGPAVQTGLAGNPGHSVMELLDTGIHLLSQPCLWALLGPVLTESFSVLLVKIMNSSFFAFRILQFILIEISSDYYLSLVTCHNIKLLPSVY